jgi:hypothetical protein
MDVLSIISVINIFGFIFVMDYCVRKRIKMTLPLILLWVVAVSALAIMLTIVVATMDGQALTSDLLGTLATNLIGLAVAFLIMDFVMFFIARFLYKKIPSISIWLGHDQIRDNESEKKRMSKLTIYTHEKPGTQEFEKIKTDLEKVAKDNTAVDTLEVEKGKENISSRRKHRKE